MVKETVQDVASHLSVEGDEEAPVPLHYLDDGPQSKKVVMLSLEDDDAPIPPHQSLNVFVDSRNKKEVNDEERSPNVSNHTNVQSLQEHTPQPRQETGGPIQRERTEGLPVVAEAYLVPPALEAPTERRREGNIVDAESVQPWHKETRARVLLFLIAALVIALAVALGISFSSNTNAATIPEPPFEVLPSPSPTRSPTVSSLPEELTKKPTGPPVEVSPSHSPTRSPTVSSLPEELTKKPTGQPTGQPSRSIDTSTPRPSPYPTLAGGKECTVLVQALLATDCNGCLPIVAIDGDSGTAVVTSSTEELKVMSQIDGVFHDVLVDQMDEIDAPSAVAISGDDIFVGYPIGSGGQVLVYKRNPITQTWLRSTALKPGDVNSFEYFGRAIAIDGDIMVIGAPGGNGEAYIYQRVQTESSSEYSWRQVRKYDDPRPDEIDYTWDLGQAVAVKGNVIAIGDGDFGQNALNLAVHGSKYERGAVFVYKSYRSSAYASRIQNMEECTRWFGRNVVLTDTGDLLVWCADPGAVYFYPQSGTAGVFGAPQKIRASDEEPGEGFGHSIATYGSVMAIGTNRESAGKVYLFASNDGIWTEFAMLEAPLSSSHFGQSVAISNDTVLVSSSHNVYAYNYSLKGCGGV